VPDSENSNSLRTGLAIAGVVLAGIFGVLRVVGKIGRAAQQIDENASGPYGNDYTTRNSKPSEPDPEFLARQERVREAEAKGEAGLGELLDLAKKSGSRSIEILAQQAFDRSKAAPEAKLAVLLKQVETGHPINAGERIGKLRGPEAEALRQLLPRTVKRWNREERQPPLFELIEELVPRAGAAGAKPLGEAFAGLESRDYAFRGLLPLLLPLADDAEVRQILVEKLSKSSSYARHLVEIAPKAPEARGTFEAMTRAEDHDLRSAGCACLGALGRKVPEAMDALIALAKSEDRRQSSTAARALGEVADAAGPRILESARGPEAKLSHDLASILAQSKPARSKVLELCLAPDTNKVVRERILMRLGQEAQDPEVVAAALQLRDRKDAATRRLGNGLLKQLAEAGARSDEVFDALIKSLGDDDEQVRRVASSAVKFFPEPKRAFPALVAAMQRKGHSTVMSNTVEVFRTQAAEPLAQLLLHRDHEVRSSARHYIRELGPGAVDAIPNLIKSLRIRNPFEREEVAKALGAIGPAAKDAVPALVKLGGGNTHDRMMAERALRGIVGEERTAALLGKKK
jgi:HEAT repeat protein